MGNKAFNNIDLGMITTLLANGAEEGSTKNELLSFSNVGDLMSLNDRYLYDYTFLNVRWKIKKKKHSAKYSIVKIII